MAQAFSVTDRGSGGGAGQHAEADKVTTSPVEQQALVFIDLPGVCIPIQPVDAVDGAPHMIVQLYVLPARL
jgi:hypothetical protein